MRTLVAILAVLVDYTRLVVLRRRRGTILTLDHHHNLVILDLFRDLAGVHHHRDLCRRNLHRSWLDLDRIRSATADQSHYQNQIYSKRNCQNHCALLGQSVSKITPCDLAYVI